RRSDPPTWPLAMLGGAELRDLHRARYGPDVAPCGAGGGSKSLSRDHPSDPVAAGPAGATSPARAAVAGHRAAGTTVAADAASTAQPVSHLAPAPPVPGQGGNWTRSPRHYRSGLPECDPSHQVAQMPGSSPPVRARYRAAMARHDPSIDKSVL